jgi:transcription elongation factor Elf1
MIKEEDYLKAKQIVQEYEKQLNISVVSHRSWECNSCGFKDYTDAISEDEIHSGLLACSNCGGDEFHLS